MNEKIKTTVICPSCNGLGEDRRNCRTCQYGNIISGCAVGRANATFTEGCYFVCERCNGTGQVLTDPSTIVGDTIYDAFKDLKIHIKK